MTEPLRVPVPTPPVSLQPPVAGPIPAGSVDGRPAAPQADSSAERFASGAPEGPNGSPERPNGTPEYGANGLAEFAGCTQAQLRRFVKSRPYVPLHELRRRFGIGGPEDDVSPIADGGRTVFVGLPAREAGLLGELIRTGEVGYELMLDPAGPMIVGVWPTRPVQRS